MNKPNYSYRPSRCLLISQISNDQPNELKHILNELENYGMIIDVINNIDKNETIQVVYNDIRDAEQAKQHLDGKLINNKRIIVEHSFPLYKLHSERSVLYNGNIVVSCEGTDKQKYMREIISSLQTFGDVYSIWGLGGCEMLFVEYYKLTDQLKVLKEFPQQNINDLVFECQSINYSPHQIELLMKPLKEKDMFHSKYFGRKVGTEINQINMNDEFNKLFSVNNSNHMNNSYNNTYNNQLNNNYNQINKNLNNTNEDNKTVEDVLKEIQQQYRKLKNISHPKSYRDEKKPKKF